MIYPSGTSPLLQRVKDLGGSNNRVQASVELLDLIDNTAPDPVIYLELMDSIRWPPDLELGRKIHSHYEKNCKPHIKGHNLLMLMYSRCASWDDIFSVWNQIDQKGFEKDIHSYKIFLSTCIYCQKFDEFLTFFHEMLDKNIAPNRDLMEISIHRSVKERREDIALYLLEHVLQFSIQSSRRISGSLTLACQRTQNAEAARTLLDAAKDNLFTFEFHMWVQLMHTLLDTNHLGEAVDALDLMFEKGIPPRERLIVRLLRECIKFCSDPTTLALGRRIHSHVKNVENPGSETLLPIVLRTMYSKCGGDATDLSRLNPVKPNEPSEVRDTEPLPLVSESPTSKASYNNEEFAEENCLSDLTTDQEDPPRLEVSTNNNDNPQPRAADKQSPRYLASNEDDAHREIIGCPMHDWKNGVCRNCFSWKCPQCASLFTHGTWYPSPTMFDCSVCGVLNNEEKMLSLIPQGKIIAFFTAFEQMLDLGIRPTARFVNDTILCLSKCNRPDEAITFWYRIQRFSMPLRDSVVEALNLVSLETQNTQATKSLPNKRQDTSALFLKIDKRRENPYQNHSPQEKKESVSFPQKAKGPTKNHSSETTKVVTKSQKLRDE